jgi:FG-GAP repeat
VSTRRAKTWIVLVAASCTLSCSWSRFGDLEDDAPVVTLSQPKQQSNGFGFGLATASFQGSAQLLVEGSPGHSGASRFDLGSSENASDSAASTAYCQNGSGDQCFAARQPAGLVEAGSPNGLEQMCFVTGLGETPANGGTLEGLFTRCQDETEYAFSLSPTVNAQLLEPVLEGQDTNQDLVLATDQTDQPSLAAATESQRLAWAYAPADALHPFDLIPPGSSIDASYGAEVAVLNFTPTTPPLPSSPSPRMFAVSAPDQGHVWLFRSDDGKTAYSIGCLGGPAGFGRTLASGPVTADTDDELVVADNTNVSVFDGTVLKQLPKTLSSDCSMTSLPQGALITSFGCGTTPAVSGCAKSGFGASLAVGDLDGDGDGEVVVGAPHMTVRGNTDAGAVLVYDVEGAEKYALTEVDFMSSAQSNDELGTTLATPRIVSQAHSGIQYRNIIAAGAPGAAKTALFYCSKLLPRGRGGRRCE